MFPPGLYWLAWGLWSQPRIRPRLAGDNSEEAEIRSVDLSMLDMAVVVKTVLGSHFGW